MSSRCRGRVIAISLSSLCVLVPALTGVSAAAADTEAAACAPSGAYVVCTYAYTGAEQRLVVPSGVTLGKIRAVGGHGGGEHGGAAGKNTTTVTVTPGQSLYVEVGGAGQVAPDRTGEVGTTPGAGGWNGGASGGPGGETRL